MRRMRSACSAPAAPDPASCSASRIESTCGWPRSPNRWHPVAAWSAGRGAVIESWRTRSGRLISPAAAVPAAVGAALAAVRICRSDEGRELFAQVLDNAAYLHHGLAELGFPVCRPTRLADGTEIVTPIVPVVVGDDWKAVFLWKALYDAGVYVNVAIHPAVPPAGAPLRTSVEATPQTDEPDRALGAFAAAKR